MSTVVLLSTFFTTKKLALSISVGFYKNSLIVACCTFSRFKFRTLTPSRFKNRTNDILKPLSHNCIHQQGFLKQKIVTLHHCRFNLKFLKYCYSDSYFGKHYWWNNSYYKLEQYWVEWLCVHSSSLKSFYFTLKSAISSTEYFHENSLITNCCTPGI